MKGGRARPVCATLRVFGSSWPRRAGTRQYGYFSVAASDVLWVCGEEIRLVLNFYFQPRREIDAD